eukprot:461670_1
MANNHESKWSSQFSDDMNDETSSSSSKLQLINNIFNNTISWMPHESGYPNIMKWSNQNIICCVNGKFITLIDMKLLYHSRPLDRVSDQCRNDLLTGLKGALSQIHCIENNNNNNNNKNNYFLTGKWCPYPPSCFIQFGS